MFRKVFILNGPNLSRLGSRETEIYGSLNLDEVERRCGLYAESLGFEYKFLFSDSEVQLMGWINEAVDSNFHVIINPAAFTHYSYALRDCAAQLSGAGLFLVEVHISNPLARESFRRVSVLADIVSGSVAGFGVDSYRLALFALDGLIAAREEL